MFQFGIGGLWVVPVGGTLANNPTPYSMLTVQDVSVDISLDLKELVGQNRFADDIAPAQMKVTGKFTPGRIDIGLFNQIFFAENELAGVKNMVKDEIGVISASDATTDPLTVTVSQSADFLTDLGVRYGSNGMAMIRSVASPIVGQYNVTGGVYTFSEDDAGVGVLISYVSAAESTGYTVSLGNTLMGLGPIFELWLSQPYQSASVSQTAPAPPLVIPNGIHLYSCRMSKLGQAMKNTDYLRPEMDFSAFANAAGQVGELFQVVP